MTRNKKNEFGIIGLGRFGMAMAKLLAEAGQDVVVLDRKEDHIRKIRELIPEALLIEDLSRETMKGANLDECSTVIIATSDIETSVLAAQELISLGVPRVIAKASSPGHGTILEKIGADVVYPETETAARLVSVLIESKALDLIRLNNDYVVSEISISEKFDGCDAGSLGLDKYDLKLAAIEAGSDATLVDFDSNYRLAKGDAIVIIGKFGDAGRFEKEVMG